MLVNILSAFLPLVMDADTNQPLDLPIVIILSSLVLDDLETTEQGTLSLAPPPEAHGAVKGTGFLSPKKSVPSFVPAGELIQLKRKLHFYPIPNNQP